MTSSSDVATMDALPPALSSMWRLCKLGYRHEPALIVAAFALALLAALPDALLALWFKLLGEGVLEGDWGRVRLRRCWRSACRPPRPGSSPPSARACSAASATR